MNKHKVYLIKKGIYAVWFFEEIPSTNYLVDLYNYPDGNLIASYIVWDDSDFDFQEDPDFTSQDTDAAEDPAILLNEISDVDRKTWIDSDQDEFKQIIAYLSDKNDGVG